MAQNSTKTAQNQQKWRKCPYKAKNCSDGLKTVFRDIIHDCMSYWPTHGAIWGSTGAPNFGPQDILGQKGPLEYINVNYIPENCLKATRAILGHAGSFLGNLRSFEAMLVLFWTPMDGPI